MISSAKIVCIYHYADFDGRGSAAIVNQRHKKQVYFVGKNYDAFSVSDFLNNFPKCKILYIVDYSLKVDECLRLLSAGIHIIWCDHHKSAIEEAEKCPCLINNPNFHYLVEKEKCSAIKLVWDYLYETKEGEYPDVVELISAWDAWLLDSPYRKDSEYFNNIYYMYDTSPTSLFWDGMFDDKNKRTKKVQALIEEGKLIERYNNTMNSILLKPYLGTVTLEGVRFLAINGTGNSKTAAPLFDKTQAQAILFYRWSPVRKTWKVSLCHADDGDISTDMAKIAQEYGGGGHIGAAGFEVDILPFNVSDIKPLVRKSF